MGVLKDTEITLIDGTTKKIKDLNSDDELLSCSISGISNKGRERDSIRWSNNNPELEKYKAKLDSSWNDGQHIYMIINNNLKISYNHLIFFKDDDGMISWDNAKVLRKGYFLLNDKFNYEIITSIKRVKIKDDMISITLSECNTYFASGYLIHNTDACDACDKCRWYSSILQPYGPHAWDGSTTAGAYANWLDYNGNNGTSIKHYDGSPGQPGASVRRGYYDGGSSVESERVWPTNGETYRRWSKYSTYELNRFYGEVIISGPGSGWWVYKQLVAGDEFLKWKVHPNQPTVAGVHPSNIHKAFNISTNSSFTVTVQQTSSNMRNNCIFWSLRTPSTGNFGSWVQMNAGNLSSVANDSFTVPAPLNDEQRREGMVKLLYGSTSAQKSRFRFNYNSDTVIRPNGWMTFLPS